MTVLATYNLKGGVGKTSSAVNLAWLAAREGLRTLLWDLDPQGAASFYFRIRPKVKGGIKRLVKAERSVQQALRGTDFDNLDLLPADFRYRKMDVVLDGLSSPRDTLGDILEPLAEAYDLIVLDCPPSISLTSESIFEASDALVVPLIPTTLAVRTLDQLLAFADRKGLEDLAVLPFFTMVDGRKRLHAELMEELRGRVPGILDTTVPAATDVERMGVERAPVGTYAPSSPAAKAYASLWAELRDRVQPVDDDDLLGLW